MTTKDLYAYVLIKPAHKRTDRTVKVGFKPRKTPMERRGKFLLDLATVEKESNSSSRKAMIECPFCTHKSPLKHYERDGFKWPAGLAHLVEAHNVHPDEDFAEMVHETAAKYKVKTRHGRQEIGEDWDDKKPPSSPSWTHSDSFARALLEAERKAHVKHHKGIPRCSHCGQGAPATSYQLGEFEWPSLLVHYVRYHNVRPPQDFINFIRGRSTVGFAREITDVTFEHRSGKQVPFKVKRVQGVDELDAEQFFKRLDMRPPIHLDQAALMAIDTTLQRRYPHTCVTHSNTRFTAKEMSKGTMFPQSYELFLANDDLRRHFVVRCVDPRLLPKKEKTK